MLEEEKSAPLSLFGIITSLGVGGVIRSLLYTLVGVVLFGILGYTTFLNGPGATESGLGAFWRVILAILIIPTYAALGGGGGLVLAITGTILAHTETMENILNRLTNPLMAILVQKLAPDKGTPVDEYLAHLDEIISRLRGEKVSGLSGPTRWIYGIILRIFRRFAAKDLLNDLQKRGESLVTKVSLERFIREGLVSYLREEFEFQLNMVRWGIYAVLGLMAGYPLYLWFHR